MATTKQVQSALQRFRTKIKKATKEVEEILETIRDLEKTVDEYDADADVEVTRGLKREIDRSKDEITDLRKAVDKLDNELSDTNRKFHKLSR